MEPQHAHRKTVLVVHDQEPDRQAVVQRLQARGFHARSVRSGREALEVARADRPDIILYDMDPPGLDGWEATRRLKADPVTRRILVVAMSANAETQARNMAMRVGCDAFEAKPVDLEHFVESVEQLFPQ